MARRRHTPEQIVRKLREADQLLVEGRGVPEVAKALEISEPTYHRWRNQCGGLKADDAKRLRELEKENARLKRIVANQTPRDAEEAVTPPGPVSVRSTLSAELPVHAPTSLSSIAAHTTPTEADELPDRVRRKIPTHQPYVRRPSPRHGIPLTGVHVAVDQALFANVRDGRIVELCKIVDTGSRLKQLGLLADQDPDSTQTTHPEVAR